MATYGQWTGDKPDLDKSSRMYYVVLEEVTEGQTMYEVVRRHMD